MLLYEMLAGVTPFAGQGDDDMETFSNILAGRLRFPRTSAFSADVVDALQGPTAVASDAPGAAHADAYGRRQVLLLRTRAAKVFALHSSTGAILWSHFVPALDAGAEPPKLVALVTARVGGVHQCIVVAQDAASYRVLTFHPHTGALLGEVSHAGVLALAEPVSYTHLTLPTILLV